ncbi:hypothetical protein V1Y59_01870 [Gordonia sp. PKS22-38]|uniref:Uncharacterized protein n=1 Tax=Gordonia prachuapensis TaxID=3115651 RepID=A0ABU7MPD4_9ACTN|nr:hypothetical protein [Gordonia sp. PKS22-38]
MSPKHSADGTPDGTPDDDTPADETPTREMKIEPTPDTAAEQEAVAADRSAAEKTAAPEERKPIIPERFRDWGHVYKTRIRTSTAVLVIAFLGSVILYGYTSQRYGVVEPPTAPAPRSTQSTTTEPSWTSTPSSTVTSTTTTTDSVETGTDGEPQTGAETGQEQTTTETTGPGLPQLPFPNFGGNQETTTVPER